MFDFSGAPVAVRDDLIYAYRSLWHHIAAAGPTMTGEQRVRLLEATRADRAASTAPALGLGEATGLLADALYHRPVEVDGEVVRAAADADGDPRTVEVLGLVSMLAGVDGTHRALGADREPLPDPVPGDPTGRVQEGLQRRRTHIPVPPGAIPVVLDLLPLEGAAFRSLFGPQYMTDDEMALDGFSRTPGLDRAQMELVSSRTSLLNECFYWTLSHVRMLRASADRFGYDFDEQAVADRSVSTGIPGGTDLLEFVDAILLEGDGARARSAVMEALDEPSLVDAAAVLGNFEMMNRVAEASGIPVSQQAVDRNAGLIEILGIGGFRH